MAKKYKGHDRVVFLDGYAQGWADCRGSKALRVAVDPALTIHKGGVRPVGPAPVRLRYTDAPGVGYNPGGEQTEAPGPARISDPCKDCATLREMGCDGKDCVHYIPGVRPYNLAKDLPASINAPGHKTVTGTELRLVEMEADKRKFHTRQPSPAELAILGPRKPCDSESMCPVAPGCHICGLTREEIATLDKVQKGKI